MRRLLADQAEIDRMLAQSAEKARAIAAPVMAETKRLVGFVGLSARLIWPPRGPI